MIKSKKSSGFAITARRKRNSTSWKLLSSIAVVLVVVQLNCMYYMTIMNSSMHSNPSEVFREQQRTFTTGKDPYDVTPKASSNMKTDGKKTKQWRYDGGGQQQSTRKAKSLTKRNGKKPIADTAEIAKIARNAHGADNHEQKDNVNDGNNDHTGGIDGQPQAADGDAEQNANSEQKHAGGRIDGKEQAPDRDAKQNDNSSFQDSSSPYYVTPKSSSHMRTNGKKPLVTGKHAMSVTKLKRNTGAPIIVVGMMKAATTSVFGYFKCGLRKTDERYVSHYDCKPNVKNRGRINMSCGRRMLGNCRSNRDAFDGMDRFVVYAEIDGQLKEGGMTLPQWSLLHQIHEQFPTATFILNMRDPKQWIKSIDKWKDLRQRFIDLNLGHEFPKGAGKTDAELEAFYLLQAQKVRDFVKAFPSHELVEIDIGSEDTGQIMQDSFGITKDCWGIRNSNPNGDAAWKMLPDDMVREKEAEKEAAKKAADAPQIADTAEVAQIAQGAHGGDNLEQEDNVDDDNNSRTGGGIDGKEQAADGDAKQNDNSSFHNSLSPYYVTPKASSHMKTRGEKPHVMGKHAMSVAKLKRNTGAPIIVVGMMKAGTTSVFGYFKCGLKKTDQKYLSHYDCKPNIKNRGKIRMSCGRRMSGNFRKKRDAFDGMDSFLVYAEIDAQIGDGMVLPQWKNLNQIHKQFPRATFILNMRDPKQWIKSIDKWKDLRQRFIDLNYKPEFPKGTGKTDAELEAFYLLQAQKVRDFVKAFPSHELVEIDIGSEDTGQIMQDSFGITKDCWGIRNSNPNGDAVWKMLPDDMVQEAKKEAAKNANSPQIADAVKILQSVQTLVGADKQNDNVDDDNDDHTGGIDGQEEDADEDGEQDDETDGHGV